MADTTSMAPPSIPRPWWRTLALTAFQVACVAYVARSLYLDRAELSRALDVSVGAIIGVTALMFVAHVQRTLEFTYMLRQLGVREPFMEGFWLTAAGYLLNHLPLNAGLVMRAALLKQDHALPYTSYLALTAVNALVNVAVGALIGLGVTAAGGWEGQRAGWALAAFGAISAAAIALICMPRSLAPRGDGFLASRSRVLLAGVASIRGNGLGLLLLAFLALTRLAGAGARLWICFGALGGSISWLGAALLGWASVLFTLVNVTPGNLGLREMVLSLFAGELGSTHTLGMAAASIERVVLLAYIVVLGIPGLLSVRRRALRGDQRPRAEPRAERPAAL
jgi:uncharacterized membrane protein YbhN (UPF0104 family)